MSRFQAYRSLFCSQAAPALQHAPGAAALGPILRLRTQVRLQVVSGMEVEMLHSLPAVAPHDDKDTTPLDEQLARELHAQLNDPQNAPPLTRRRTRKAPSFYTPQVRAT